MARAVEEIVKANFQQGYTALEALRTRYSVSPGSAICVAMSPACCSPNPNDFGREKGPVFFAGILPDYDPMPVLQALRTPQLWILGADDIDAPPQETWRRLLKLRREGRPIAAVMLRGPTACTHSNWMQKANAHRRVCIPNTSASCACSYLSGRVAAGPSSVVVR